MDNLLKNYVYTMLNLTNQNDIISEDFFDMGDESQMQKDSQIQKELLTVISLKDNPNLNLSVAQPSKYKIEHSNFGQGILCYSKKALDILNTTIKPNEKVIKISIELDSNKCLDLCSTKNKQYLREVYRTIEDKQAIKNDYDFINYVCQKGKYKYDAILYYVILGKPLFAGSIITDYMGQAILIRNSNIIISAEEI